MLEKLKVEMENDSDDDEETRTKNKKLVKILGDKKRVEKQTQKSMKMLADVFRDTRHNTVTKLSLSNGLAFIKIIKELNQNKFEGASTLCPIIKDYTKDSAWQTRGERILSRKEHTEVREILKYAVVGALKALGPRAKERVTGLPWIKAMKQENPWFKYDGDTRRDALTGERADVPVRSSRGGLRGGARDLTRASVDSLRQPNRGANNLTQPPAPYRKPTLSHLPVGGGAPADPRTKAGDGLTKRIPLKLISIEHRMPRVIPTEVIQPTDGISDKQVLAKIRRNNIDKPPYPDAVQIAAAQALIGTMKPAPANLRLPTGMYTAEQTRRVFTVFGLLQPWAQQMGHAGMALGGDDHNYLPTIYMEPRARVWCCRTCDRVMWAKPTIPRSPYPFPWIGVMSNVADLGLIGKARQLSTYRSAAGGK